MAETKDFDLRYIQIQSGAACTGGYVLAAPGSCYYQCQLPIVQERCCAGRPKSQYLQRARQHCRRQDSIVTVFEPGVYAITASDTLGCTKSFTVNTSFRECSACTVYMPDAFTPNNDGLNDVLKGHINCPVDEYQLKIYNRWGQNVFQTNIVDKGWDGTFKGNQQSTGVYTYFIRFKNSAFEQTYKTKKGTVMIIR